MTRRGTRESARNRAVATGLVAIAVLAACSDDAGETADSSASTVLSSTTPLPIGTTPPGENDTVYPVEVTGCDGRVSTIAQHPERVVVLDESIAETLVMLGERNAIVGLVREHPDEMLWRLAADGILSRQVIGDPTTPPTKDAIERVGPELVLATDPSRLDGPGAAATADEWAAAGVASLVGRSGCDAGGELDGLELFAEDLRTLGVVFDARLRAEKLVSQVQAGVEQFAQQAQRVGADELTVWAYGGEDVEFGRSSVVEAVLRAIGVTVVDAGPDDLAAVAEADPDVIWLITPRGADPEEAGATLRAELDGAPELRSVSAVADGSFVVTAAVDIAPSPRLVDGVQDLVTALTAS